VIEGAVNIAYEAVIPLRLPGPEGLARDIEAVVDTGYSGFLTLPATLVTELRGCVTYPLSLWERVRVRAYPGSCKNELRHYNSLTTGSMDLSHTL
jgi:hypothetical protein